MVESNIKVVKYKANIRIVNVKMIKLKWEYKIGKVRIIKFW